MKFAKRNQSRKIHICSNTACGNIMAAVTVLVRTSEHSCTDAGPTLNQQTQSIWITFWPNVFEAGLTLYKCYTNVLCLLGKMNIKIQKTKC